MSYFTILFVMLSVHFFHVLLLVIDSDGCTKCLEDGFNTRLTMMQVTGSFFALRLIIDAPLIALFYRKVRIEGGVVPTSVVVLFVAAFAAWLSFALGQNMTCGSDCDPPLPGGRLLEAIGNIAPFLSAAFYALFFMFIGEMSRKNLPLTK
jgi:hypothetical protein